MKVAQTPQQQEGECYSLQSCLIPCDPMDCSPTGSSVHGILQARILERFAISFSSIEPRSPTVGGGFFLFYFFFNNKSCAQLFQWCPTLCNPMDCSLTGSFVHAKNTGVGCHVLLQGSPWPRDPTFISCVSCITGRFFTHWATWEIQSKSYCLFKNTANF